MIYAPALYDNVLYFRGIVDVMFPGIDIVPPVMWFDYYRGIAMTHSDGRQAERGRG